MADIKEGDVVQLKSGGPGMTVESIGKHSINSGSKNGVKCVWFINSEHKTAVFDMNSLKNLKDN